MTMLIAPFVSTKLRHPWSFLGVCTSCKYFHFHYIAYDASLPHQPLAARIVLFHMLAFVNRKVNQRVALAVQVGQSRYVLFFELQKLSYIQIITISEQGIDRSH